MRCGFVDHSREAHRNTRSETKTLLRLGSGIVQPFVSIIIPVYNTEAFVADAIQSVLDQTWPAKEIIAVDDGSTDRSAEVLKSFAPRIKVIEQENRGASAARNRALREAQGEFIQYLDADDFLA